MPIIIDWKVLFCQCDYNVVRFRSKSNRVISFTPDFCFKCSRWEISAVCEEHTDPSPRDDATRYHEPASSKQSLLNIGDGSDSGLQQAVCLTSVFPDVVEFQPQCAFYCIIIIILVHTKHDCSIIRCELLLISTMILLQPSNKNVFLNESDT